MQLTKLCSCSVGFCQSKYTTDNELTFIEFTVKSFKIYSVWPAMIDKLNAPIMHGPAR